MVAQLNLHTDRLFAVGKKDWNFQNHVIAAVTVRFWILDVILLFDDGQVILSAEHLDDSINVLDKRADDADASNVVEVSSAWIPERLDILFDASFR